MPNALFLLCMLGSLCFPCTHATWGRSRPRLVCRSLRRWTPSSCLSLVLLLSRLTQEPPPRPMSTMAIARGKYRRENTDPFAIRLDGYVFARFLESVRVMALRWGAGNLVAALKREVRPLFAVCPLANRRVAPNPVSRTSTQNEERRVVVGAITRSGQTNFDCTSLNVLLNPPP